MQRVVRSSLVGLLTLAALAACGDSGDQTPVTPTGTDHVHSVTVSPSQLTLAVGGTGTLAASVDADGSLDRTVTWSSSDATIASVDATSGKVTGVKAGSATVTATSKADANVKGAAAVTVTGAGGNGAIPAVTISAINKGGNPVNIGNVTGQIDVVLNVDTNGGVLKSVTSTLKCGTDSIVNSQTVSNLAPVAAEAAAAPVTLSFNTAQFSSAGVAALHNGTCTISAQATTSAGVQSAVNSTTLTLNNADVIYGSVTFGNTKTDASGLAWEGTSVAVAVTPVFYTAGRTAASTAITLTAGGVKHTQTVTGAGTHTVTYTDNNDKKSDSLNIDQVTDSAATVTVTTIDSNGQPFANTGNMLVSLSSNALSQTNVPSFRLDTQKPLPGTFVIANNAGQNTSGNGYINGSFRFAGDSAAGYCGPNSTGYAPGNVTGGVSNGTPACTGNTTANRDSATTQAGVDQVTVVFQTYVTATGSKKTGVTATNPSALAESQTASTYTLQMITTDALGNADTTAVGTFGVDLTAPSTFASTKIAGPNNQQIYTTTGNAGPNAGGQQFQTSGITDNLSGPGPMLVAQTRNTTLTDAFATKTADKKTYTNTGATGTVPVSQAVADLSPCVIGRFNTSQSAAGANALTVYSQTGSVLGYCTPVAFNGNSVPPDAAADNGGTQASEGYFTTEIIGIDQAGNTSAPFIATIVADATGPSVTQIDLPGSVTPNGSVPVSATASDSVDVLASYAAIHYAGGSPVLRNPRTAVPNAAAFDNTLTRSVTVQPAVNNFIRNLSPNGTVTASTTTSNDAQSIDVGAVDEANRTNFRNAALSVGAVVADTGNTWSSKFTGNVTVAADSSTISNCPVPTSSQTTGCGSNGSKSATHPTSVNLTASASGTTGTFSNPFASVTFWRQLPNGDYVQIGSTSSASVTDSGSGATGRVWSYTVSYDPPSVDEYGNVLAPQYGSANVNMNVIAVGVNSSGDAIATAPITVQLSNP